MPTPPPASPNPRLCSTLSSRRPGGLDTRLVELEEQEQEVTEDFSTISGYDSLETGLNMSDVLLSFANPNYSGPEVTGAGEEQERHASFAAALMSPCSGEERGTGLELREAGGGRKARPRSAVVASTKLREGREEPAKPRPLSTGPEQEEQYPAQLRLLMYVVGGREVGQVTVFRRPLSIWRLELTRL